MISRRGLRNRFALSLNYELPFGKDLTGAKKLALGGWQVNTIAVWETGKDFSIFNGGTRVDMTTALCPSAM